VGQLQQAKRKEDEIRGIERLNSRLGIKILNRAGRAQAEHRASAAEPLLSRYTFGLGVQSFQPPFARFRILKTFFSELESH
jgi:hypothetical protein